MDVIRPWWPGALPLERKFISVTSKCYYYSDTSVEETLTPKQAVLILARSERADGQFFLYFLSTSFAYWHQSCDIHQINRAVSVSPPRLQLLQHKANSEMFINIALLPPHPTTTHPPTSFPSNKNHALCYRSVYLFAQTGEQVNITTATHSFFPQLRATIVFVRGLCTGGNIIYLRCGLTLQVRAGGPFWFVEGQRCF